jgi:hypothetical protein
MGLPITTLDDYKVGYFKLPFNDSNLKDLQSFIDRQELGYLEDLLGCELAQLFIDDLDSITNLPVTQRFIDIYNRFCYESNCLQIKSNGLNEVLKSFIWSDYIRYIQTPQTLVGTKQNNSEVSINLGLQASRITEVYNNGIDSYCAIQYFINDNISNYPEYEGVSKKYTSWL